MADIEGDRAERVQEAILWPLNTYDRHGQPTVGNPVELLVRWVGQQSQSLDPAGNVITIDATVVLDQDVTIDSLMWLGTLNEWKNGGGSQAPGKPLMVVKAFNSTPDVRGRATRRTAGLMRYQDQSITLPTAQ